MVEELPRASPHCPCLGPQGTHPHPWALVTTGSCPVAPRGPQSLQARVPRLRSLSGPILSAVARGRLTVH